jgi:nickel-dependent lactate racemase
MVVGEGSTGRFLSTDDMRRLLRQALAGRVDGQRVLVIIPDGTRTMPMPLMAALLDEVLGARVAALDYLVALGTHQPMDDAQLGALVGRPVSNGRAGRSRVDNHRWDDPATFATFGTLSAAEVAELTGGLIDRDVPVALNRRLRDYDHLLVCGPVFPHEVVGFSGGTKYFVPGVAGQDIIDLTHWLGALLTSTAVIGTGYTPVRAVIDRAAAFIDRPSSCISLVVTHEGVAGMYIGGPHASWEAAAALSSEVHIVRVPRPFTRVLAVMPSMYADLWTAAKGMYKLEPIVADGGELVIYAPHISEVSFTHGRILDEVGYHCRDYFTCQWERFGGQPGGVLAHATHVKGRGLYDAATGVESPRISVTLATAIPPERCARINLGYRNPATIRIDEWTGREHEGVLVVPRAGEILYRLESDRPPAGAGFRAASRAGAAGGPPPTEPAPAERIS